MLRSLSLLTFALACLLVVLPPSSGPAHADERTAERMEGKDTLFKRVITKPGAVLRDGPGQSAAALSELPPFSIYYVYDGRSGFTEVGVNSHGETAGWIEDQHLVDWKQSIVVAFNNRAEAGRTRQVFFSDLPALETAINEGGPPASFADKPNVVALEPENAINDSENFYLLPILDHESTYFPDDSDGNELEVASITEEEASTVDEPFKVAIVFVVDTTVSMDRYIRQTKEAIEQITSELTNAGLADEVSFGLVGFRQSPAGNPGVEYHVRNFLPLGENADVDAFLNAIDGMGVAHASTKGFREDALGGLVYAERDNDWTPYKARYMVLVTDAGAREPRFGDNYYGSLDIPEAVNELRDNNISLSVLHLHTPAGDRDFANASREYQDASRLAAAGQSGSLYASFDGRDISGYRMAVDNIAKLIVETTEAIRDGEEVEEPDPNNQSLGANLQRAARAFQLDYVGARQGDVAPDFYRAWTIDRAYGDYARQALDVQILLTKNQLSSMAINLREIVDEANRPGALFDANQFFSKIQEIALRTANDPSQVNETTTLGDAIAEYLEDLPYKSQVTAMTMADWVSAGSVQQRDLINSLMSKLAYYERVHDDPDRWFALHENAAPGEYVTTISLDRMP
ncbi:UNVERIFIED_ORG: serine/threonine-protein kinase PpkA [Martelella mediterranea]